MKQIKRLLSLALALILLLGTVSGSLIYAAAEEITTVLSNGNEVTVNNETGVTTIRIKRFANGTYQSKTPYGVGDNAAKLCHAFVSVKAGDTVSMKLPDGYQGYVALGYDTGWTYTPEWLQERTETFEDDYRAMVVVRHCLDGKTELALEPAELAEAEIVFTLYPAQTETTAPVTTETQEIVLNANLFVDGGYTSSTNPDSFNATTTTNTKRVRTQEMTFYTGDKISFNLPDGWYFYGLTCLGEPWPFTSEWLNEGTWTITDELSGAKSCMIMKKEVNGSQQVIDPSDLVADMAADPTSFIKYTRQMPKDVQTFEMGTYAENALVASTNRMRTIKDVPVKTGDVVAFDLPDGWSGYVLFCNPTKSWTYAPIVPKGAPWPNSYRHVMTEDTICRIVVRRDSAGTCSPAELHTAMANDPTSYVTYDLADLSAATEKPAEPGDVTVSAFVNGYYTEGFLTSGEDEYLRTAAVDVQAGDSCEFTLPEGMVGAILRAYEFGAWAVTDWANSGDWTFSEDTRAVLLVKKADGSDIAPADLGETVVTYHKQNKNFDIAAEVTTMGFQDYYQDELEDTIEKLTAILGGTKEEVLVFPLLSDMHYESSSVMPHSFDYTVENMKKVESELQKLGYNFDFTACIGDITDGTTNEAVSDRRNNHIISRFRELDAPLFLMFGNHDGIGFSQAELYTKFIEDQKTEDPALVYNTTTEGDNPTNFHRDYKELGIRCVFLNAIETYQNDSKGDYWYRYKYTEDTCEWFDDTVEDAIDKDLSVLVFTHISPGNRHNYNYTSTAHHPANSDKILASIRKAQAADKYICLFSGHNHYDAVFDPEDTVNNPDGFWAVTVNCNKFDNANGNDDLWSPVAVMQQNREKGTYTEDCFDVVVLRPETKQLDLIRFGAGGDTSKHGITIDDRHIDFETCKHTTIEAVDATSTCTAHGYGAHYKCAAEDCGMLFADAEGKQKIVLADTVSSDSAVLVEVPAKAATCKETGNVQYWKCSDANCDKLFADAEGKTETTLEAVTLAKDEENHVGGTRIDGAVDATTSSTGYTGDTVCNSCDTVLEYGEVIPVVPSDYPGYTPIAPIKPAKPAQPTVSAPMTFRDVAKTDWYYSEVEKAYEAGLINGMGDNEFAPEKTLTVAEAIKLAAALHQLDKKGEVTLENGLSSWYSTYVDYAVINNVIDDLYAKLGKDEMNDAITRADFVKILHGALPYYNAINNVPDNSIPDVKMDHPYAAEIYALYRAGILTGNDAAGTFNPNATIKRCEVAAILIRMFDSSARKSITLG